MPVMRVLLVSLLVSCGSEGSNEPTGGSTPDLGTDDDAGSPGGGRGEPAPSGSGLPAYRDPVWTEPAPPGEAEVSTAVGEVQADAAARLEPEDLETLAMLATTVHPSTAAATHVQALRLDAAAWLFAESHVRAPSVSALAALAGLEAQRGSKLERAELLARGALGLLGPIEAVPPRLRRVAASAAANLGDLRRQQGQAAGAVFAYRLALRHFPGDPMYLTGLAAALSDADLPVPALHAAFRARTLERLADPSLASEPRPTPATAWVSALEARVREGVAPPETLGRGGDAPMPRFPEVGSQLFGITVLAETPGGGWSMSAPPLEAHGLEHLGDGILCEAEGAERDFTCRGVEDGLMSWAPLNRDLLVQAGSARAEGTSCEEAIASTVAPDLGPMQVMPLGPSGVGAALGGLGFALNERFQRVAGDAFGVGIGGENLLLTQLETCSDFATRSGSMTSALERVDAGCPNCESACVDDAACRDCFDAYRVACDTLYGDAARMAANEELRAFEDDQPFQQNIERTLLLSLGLEASLNEALHLTCPESGCEVQVDPNDYRFLYAQFIGGRSAQFLFEIRSHAARAYLGCVALIPPECPASGGGGARGEAGRVPCLCLGAGPVSYCLHADGAFEVTVGEGVVVGVRGNVNAGARSIRYGLGAGFSANAGPLSAGATVMAWYDPTAERFLGFEADVGVDVNVPAGTVGTVMTCDAWEDDAAPNEADPDLFAVESTPESP